METSFRSGKEREEVARVQMLAMPSLMECGPEHTLTALKRSHLELTMRANQGRMPLQIEDNWDVQDAFKLQSAYHQELLARIKSTPNVILDLARIVSGADGIGSQLTFASEVSERYGNGVEKWWCWSQQGLFSYLKGPVVTHVQTSFIEQAEQDTVRDFYRTPLFSREAFNEDLDRIREHGAQLTIGHRKQSYALCVVLQKIAASELGKGSFQPSSVDSVAFAQTSNDQADIKIHTYWAGLFTAQIKLSELGECLVNVRHGAVERDELINGELSESPQQSKPPTL